MTICVLVNCDMRIYFFFILIIPQLILSCAPDKSDAKMQQVLGLQNMSDLATAEYVVTKLIKANDNKTWYKIGDRKILMSCKATLVAGIDMSKLSKENINMDDKKISLTLPHAKLLYINIKPEDIKTEYQDISVFREKFSSQERNELAAQAEDQIRKSADSLGIFTTAETNATIFINNFLKREGFQHITIAFTSNNPSLQ